ncbi:MAG: hypothetical protein LBU19_05175 [Treponema sp.]|jgi:hypothetical protein|nr:hypothetical protein [Treponema sp.]
MSYKKTISTLPRAQTLHGGDLLLVTQPGAPNPATGENGASANAPLDDLAAYVAGHGGLEGKINGAVGAERARAEGIEAGLRADADSSVKKDIGETMVEKLWLPGDGVTAEAVAYKKRSVTLADGTAQEVSMPLPVASGTGAGIVTARDKALIGEIEGKISSAEKGAANGVATLNAYGKIPSSQIPASYDEVLEFADYASLPQPGMAGKVYIALDTGLTYRWGDTAYAKIGQDLALGETEGTAYPGQLGKAAAAAVAALEAAAGAAGGTAQLDGTGKVPAAQLPHGGGIPEAPADNKQYARKNSAWAEVDPGTPDYGEAANKPAIGGVELDKNSTAAGLGLETAAAAGDNADLATAEKGTLVGAVNEVNAKHAGKADTRTTAPGDPRDSRIINEISGKGPWIYNKKSGIASYAGVLSQGDENGSGDRAVVYSVLAPQFLGHFNTLAELETGAPSPSLYDWYGVGAAEPYGCYQWIDGQWAYKGKNGEGSRLFATENGIIYEKPGENFNPGEPVSYGMELARKGDLPDAGIPEAPADGKQYARKDGIWAEVDRGDSGIGEAPEDGRQYARKNGIWDEIAGTPDASGQTPGKVIGAADPGDGTKDGFAEAVAGAAGTALKTIGFEALKARVGEAEENLEEAARKAAAMQGRGGYLTAHDFGTRSPSQQALTDYALAEIGIEDPLEIFNGTHVKNTYADPDAAANPQGLPDNHAWVLTNTPDTDPPVFGWADNGLDSAGVAGENVLGFVSGSGDPGKVAVHPVTGEMSVNGTADPGDGSKDGFAAAAAGGGLKTIGFAELKARVGSAETAVAGKQPKIAARTGTGDLVLLAPASAGGAPGTVALEDLKSAIAEEAGEAAGADPLFPFKHLPVNVMLVERAATDTAAYSTWLMWKKGAAVSKFYMISAGSNSAGASVTEIDLGAAGDWKAEVVEAVNGGSGSLYQVFATVLFYREGSSTAYVYSYYQNRNSATGAVTSMKEVNFG